MAFNPDPKVEAARNYAKTFDKQQVIIFAVDKDGNLEYASYGENKPLCHNAKVMADIAFDALMEYWR